MRIAIDHNMTKEQARQRVEQRLVALLGQFSQHAGDLEHDWYGDVLRFKGKARGMKIDGTVEVTESAVLIDGKLPLIALPFEKRIREAVEKEADAMFRTA